MIFEAGLVLGAAFQVNKSMKIDEQAQKKNGKAFAKSAEAQKKLEQCEKETFSKLEINAKRKNGIIMCHLKLFEEQYSVIRKIHFKKGKGIEELEKIDEIQNKLHQYLSKPAISSGKAMTSPQLLISVALRGIGGQMIKDSEMNLKLASLNLSQANAIAAQADSICIALEGIARHADLITQLLEKLGMLYMKSINQLKSIIETNGMNPENYSDLDIDVINTSMLLTKLIYRIINTPLIDKDGKIEKESQIIIDEGNQLLQSIFERK